MGCLLPGKETVASSFRGEVHRLLSEGRVMGLEVAEPIRTLTPQEYGRLAAAQPAAASARLGWSGVEALLFNDMPDAEFERPPLTHHELVLFNRPPDVFGWDYQGVRRNLPPPAGTHAVVPAGTPARRQWRGHKGSMLVFPEPDLVTRVAARQFGRGPARGALPPPGGGGPAAGGVAGQELPDPPLQAARRRHAGAVPNARKNRLTALKYRQDTGRRVLYSQDRGASRPGFAGDDDP